MLTTIYYTLLVFQFTRGDGALETGIRLLPLMSMIILFSILNGVLMPKLGYYSPWQVDFPDFLSPLSMGLLSHFLVLPISLRNKCPEKLLDRIHVPLGNAVILAGAVPMFRMDATTSDSAIYGYTALICMAIGSFLTASVSVAQTIVGASEASNAVGAMMPKAQNVGTITFLGVAGSLYGNIGVEKLGTLLPGHSASDLLQLTTGTRSSLFESLSPELQTEVAEQITLSIRNGFGIIVGGSALSFISAFFLSRHKVY
ncbi:putative MFS general substrate transporter [Seiridium cardinale]|uniref:MFS general substrate transporter n=1 Tax=Seiridium cardinale TaxID=138064 RepID=A0ABR2Y8F1_9PEZI